MAFTFPSSPTTDQVITGPGGTRYQWVTAGGGRWTVPQPDTFVLRSGDTMTGPLTLAGDAVGLLEPVTLSQLERSKTGRNYIANGRLGVLQRGNGPWSTGGYTADRWLLSLGGDAATFSSIPLTVADTAEIGSPAAIRAASIQFTGGGGANYTFFSQRMEAVQNNTGVFTLSFWARAYTGTPRVGCGYEQYFGPGGSPGILGNIGVTTPLSTAWQFFNFTATIPSTIGKTIDDPYDYTGLEFWLSDGGNNAVRSGGIGPQTGGVVITMIQLEALPFATDYADGEHVVQRYYWSTNFNMQGYNTAGNWDVQTLTLPTTMRAIPTCTLTLNTGTNIGAFQINALDTTAVAIATTAAATGPYSFIGRLYADAEIP